MELTRRLTVLMLLASCLTLGAGTALAGTAGAHISGALGDNPALLGFAPVVTMAVETGVAIPGLAGAQSLIDKWYDEETEQLSIRLDFSNQEKAEESMATIDQAVQTLSGVDGRGLIGLSLGRLGLGATFSGGTSIVNRSSFDPDADNDMGFDAKLDLVFDALQRVDAVVAIGLPIGRSLAAGTALKRSWFFAEQGTVQATAEQIREDSSAADPKTNYEVGRALLLDAGLALDLKHLQADVVLKDIGNVEWQAEEPPWDDNAVAGVVRPHDKPMHVSGGVTLKPFRSVDLSARYDKTVFGATTVRTEAALRPMRWLTLKVGQVSIDGKPAYLTMGGGMRLWVFGFDGGIMAKDNTIVGGRARLSIGF